ncbi:DNA topoisomerase I [Desulfobacter postgatei]|uniref:DNA topoisomerase I n=1 Tax=Desulfobacter postgatei TaxID=2293 RepID=UPI002A36BFD0|nr:DNA topoisomerase I [Desulfobacter postgatei]MDX9962249.1 DNA topoisomerase I [Desulfobacter postgatei]
MPQGSSTTRESVRKQLDEIIAKEITAFIDVDSNMALMSFNLATISCIVICVDREREIKEYADAPPERFNRKTFTSELVDIGLDQDDYLDNAISTVLGSGYITTLPNGELKSEMPAFMMVGFLDSMFPGMQGLNLIAFILQMNEEVNSGRKSLELAKQSFEKTLKTRGVSVTKDRAQERATEMVKGIHKAVTVQSKQISARLKREKLNKLSQLMKTRKQRTDGYHEKVKIKNLFDKEPSPEEIEAEKQKARENDKAALKAAELAKELAGKEEKIKQAELTAQKLAEQLKVIEEKQKAAEEAIALEAQEKAEALVAKEQEMAEREARLITLEEKLKRREEEAKKEAEAKKLAAVQSEKEKKQDDIESRIATFEQTLSMPCPLCRNGSVQEKTTDKGKVFYSCNQKDCRFVSWDKPYHFECPLCKNPYLTEFITPSDTPGLKCPRASCTYSQNNLLPPAQHMAANAAPTEPAPKKKKLVRRVKRRR